MYSEGDRVVKYNVIPTGFKTSGGLAIGNMNLNNYFAPTSLDTPNMTIYVVGGTILLSKTTILDVSAQISPTFSAPGGSNKRIDLLWVDVNGILHIKQGTATTGTPEIPEVDSAITNQGFPICFVYLRGSSSQIKSSDDSTNNYIYADLRFALANRYEKVLSYDSQTTDLQAQYYDNTDNAFYQDIFVSVSSGTSNFLIYKKVLSNPSIDKTITNSTIYNNTAPTGSFGNISRKGIVVDSDYVYLLQAGDSGGGVGYGDIHKFSKGGSYIQYQYSNNDFISTKIYPFGMFFDGTNYFILNPNGLWQITFGLSNGSPFSLGSLISFSTPYSTSSPLKMNITKIDSTNFYLNEIGTTLIKKVNTSGTMSASQTMKAGIKATIKIGSDFYAIINGTGANSELQKITI